MLTVSALFFAAAALAGLTLAVKYFRGQEMPLPLSFTHGALAATGLVLLIIAVAGSGLEGNARNAMIVFIAAALGGFYLFARHLRGQSRPKAVILIHGGAAVLGFVLLLLAIFSVSRGES